jgi:CubicO group peptidase (beta-lactamase class C family)
MILAFTWLLAGGSLLLHADGRGQEDVGDKVDQLVHREMRRQHIPGVSLAVITNGQIILAKGYGLANVELQAPVKPETIFQSGSVGKQFTATAVMLLVEAGEIHLDDKISKYLTKAPESWGKINVYHC